MIRLKQHYALLRIKPGAKLDEIKQAYQLAERDLHEDRLAEDPLVRHQAQERLRKINEAYLEIMDTYQEVQASLSEGDMHFKANRSAGKPTVIAAVESERGVAKGSSPKRKSSVISKEAELSADTSPSAAAAQHRKVPPGDASSPNTDGTPGASTEHIEEKGAPGSGPPDTVGPDDWDPAKLVRTESYLLISVVALVIFVIVITWIRTTLKSSAPSVTANKPAPVETASPSGEPAKPTGTVPKHTVKQRTTFSHPTRQSAAGNAIDAGVVLRDAEQGNAKAQALLGYLFMAGSGVRKDPAAAVKWFRSAAAQGNAQAEDWLGYLYETGTGVPRNYAEAVRWYRLAAEQGDADAQKNLGRMYAKGRGVTKNRHEAIKWLRKAATQGNEEAQRALEIWEEE